MIREEQINEIVDRVIFELKNEKTKTVENKSDKSVCLEDITTQDIRTIINIPQPVNKDALLTLKEKTRAKIGIWRAGPRLTTDVLLRFRADHALAKESVFADVDEDTINSLGMFCIQTKCKDKEEHLTRPDLGRDFSDETIRELQSKCKKSPRAQIFVSDGLSSSSITANIKNVYPALMQGLELYGIDTGTPFFVKYGRVPAMDVISEVLDAEVTCVFIGERPGLATAESMSAYIVYRAHRGISESSRTVVSNIHKGGLTPVEAGAYVSEIIYKMLDRKKSGVELRL